MMPRLLSRRAFLRLGTSALATCGLTGAYTVFVEPAWVEIVRRDLPIAHLPEGLEGRTLVQLSDIHVGHQVSDAYLRGAFELVNALEPDLLVITGDFMTCQRDEQIDHTRQILESLRPARLGTVAVLGNHDSGGTFRNTRVAAALARALSDLGIRVLRNDWAEVAGLTIAGLDDLWSQTFYPEAVLPALRSDRANLVLCHNPDACDLPVWGDYRGWILSGHTHGGQCKPPFLPPPRLPVDNPRYTAGEFDLGQGRRLYINRALGHVLKVRFNVRPEITCFRLTSA